MMRMMRGRAKTKKRDAGVLALSFAVALAMIAGCEGGREGVLLGTEPLDRVDRVEDELEALASWVTSEQKADVIVRFDLLDDIAVVPASLEQTMKNAADHLKHGNTYVIDELAPFLSRSGMLTLGYEAGLYKRVVWVLPFWNSLAYVQLETFKRFLIEKRGYRPQDLLDFTVEGNNIVGTLGGVPVTATTMQDLEIGENEAIVDIDLSYFPGLIASGSSYNLGVSSTLDFLRRLREKKIKTRFVTVTLSNQNGSVPLVLRYLGDVITRCIENPVLLSDTIPKWEMMAEAERLVETEQYPAADSLYGILIKDFPAEPGFYYSRAMVLALMGQGIDSGRHIGEAYRLDGMYLKGFFQLANFVAVKGNLQVAQDIVNTPPLMEVMPYGDANYNMGVMYIAGGQPGKALPFLNNAARYTGGRTDLYNLLFRTARDAGNEPEMMAALEKLIESDATLMKEKMPWVYRELGILYEKDGRLDDATKMYRRYIEAAPQDSLVPEFRKKVLKLRKRD